MKPSAADILDLVIDEYYPRDENGQRYIPEPPGRAEFLTNLRNLKISKGAWPWKAWR